MTHPDQRSHLKLEFDKPAGRVRQNKLLILNGRNYIGVLKNGTIYSGMSGTCLSGLSTMVLFHAILRFISATISSNVMVSFMAFLTG